MVMGSIEVVVAVELFAMMKVERKLRVELIWLQVLGVEKDIFRL